jgi:hypothetical protein
VTAEKVGNFRVVAVEPVIRRGKDGGGTPSPTTVKLTLDNGEKVYGCKLCTYTTSNTGSMHGHLTRHHRGAQSLSETPQAQPEEPEETVPESAQEESAAPAQAPVVKAVMSMTVGELLSYVAFLEADGERPEALRARAEAAEAEVAQWEARFAAIKASLD